MHKAVLPEKMINLILIAIMKMKIAVTNLRKILIKKINKMKA